MTTRPLAGSFKEVRRHVISATDDDHRSCYLGMDGRVALADLLAHLQEVAPGVSYEDLGINFGTVTWVDDATDEEKRTRVIHANCWHSCHARSRTRR